MSHSKMLNDIVQFHQKFDVLPPTARPALLPRDLQDFRQRFLQEELNEFQQAYLDKDLPGALDALIDLVYVALGTAYLMSCPFAAGWDAVHEANMAKVKASSALMSLRQSVYDVIKPPGWQAPDIQAVIDAAG